MNETQQSVLIDVARERKSQDKKWGTSRILPNDTYFRILGEEVGEVARALNEGDSFTHTYDELIQVAAVATEWCEAIREGRVK